MPRYIVVVSDVLDLLSLIPFVVISNSIWGYSFFVGF